MNSKSDLANQVLDAIRSVSGSSPIYLHEPSFRGNEWKYLKECLDSTFVSSIGKFVDLFEDNLASYTGAKHAVAVVNGTAALHIALKLAGVRQGHEVLIPALTFVATANAVSYCNAVPHFVDSESNTLGIDVAKLKAYLLDCTEQHDGKCINPITGNIIKALVPMHTFGHPSDLEGLLAIANDFNIILIEDAAESLGSIYHGKHTGTFGLLGTLSFNGNKTITTGGGGAILTNNDELAGYAKHLITTAKVAHPWGYVHDEIGYNYRMPNINAALGCAQLERLPDMLTAKRQLFSLYEKAFLKVDNIHLVEEPKDCQSNYWLQTLLLDAEHSDQRDIILKLTNDNGIMTRPAWSLMSELPAFKDSPSMNLEGARSLFSRLINIPSSPFLVEGNYE